MSKTVAGRPGVDPTLPSVRLILGGRERHLCFDFNAIAQVENVTGLNLLTSLIGFPNFTQLAGLLWAALLKEDTEIQIEEIATLVTPKTAPAIHAAVVAAWFASSESEDVKGSAKGKRRAQAKTRA